MLSCKQPAESDSNAGDVGLICALEGTEPQMKSTCLRSLQQVAWQHETASLRQAGRQHQRNVAAVLHVLINQPDLAQCLGLKAGRLPDGCLQSADGSTTLLGALARVLLVAGGRATLQAAALALAGGEANARRGNGFGRADVAFGSDFLGHGEFQKWGWTNPLLGHTAHAGPWRGLHAWAERTRMSFDPPCTGAGSSQMKTP